jgi:hypothetical protein
VLDGILLEKAGVPAVSVVTDGFTATGKAMAANWGVPAYRFISMPHPIANLTEQELDARAERLAAQVLALLQEGQAG